MNLIIVGGQTSTGKSTLSRHLMQELGIKGYLKDAYKEEEYFPSLVGLPTVRQWVHSELESWRRVYAALQKAQAEDYDLLVEGNFAGAQRRRIKQLLRSDTNVVEVFCYARGFTTWRRYVARNKSGERHPGHRDSLWYWIPWTEALCKKLGWDWVKPMRFSPHVLSLDTTDFEKIDYEVIKRFVVDLLRD